MHLPSRQAVCLKGGVVAGETNLGKGSKRNVRLVRWSRSEKLSMIVLFLVVVIETLWVAWWLTSHSFD
jgi:hypothetical protein